MCEDYALRLKPLTPAWNGDVFARKFEHGDRRLLAVLGIIGMISLASVVVTRRSLSTEAKFGTCYGETMSSESVMPTLREFVIERDWGQFHSAENLAKSISIESGELLECFQWNDEAHVERVKAELADVLTYAYLLADRIGVDPNEIILEKLQETRTKYPVDKARGRSTKYDRL